LEVVRLRSQPFAVDAQGHDHKGSGPGGGQFAPKGDSSESAKTKDGKTVHFVPHPNQRPDETTVMIDPVRFEAEWSKDPAAIKPDGSNASPGKLAGVQAYLKSGKPVAAPRVAIGVDGTPDVIDGRHRIRSLVDAGLDRIAVTVPKDQVDDIQKRYGKQPTATDKPPEPSHSLDGLKDKLPAVDAGTWEKIKHVATRTHEAVYGWMVRATPTIMKLMPDVIENSEDFQKLGFNPGLSGTSGPRTGDPIYEATGIGTHMMATIASHVLAKAFVWTKNKLAGQTNAAEDSDVTEAAIWLSGLLSDIAAETGLALVTDPMKIAAILAGQ
jgi:hypothetical protein